MGGAGDGAARLTVFGGLPRILKQELPQFHFAASVYACLDEDGNGPGLELRRGPDGRTRGDGGSGGGSNNDGGGAGKRLRRTIATTDQDEATIVLHVVNYAGLSGDVVSEAKARVARVYEAIGIRTVWAHGEGLAGKRQDDSLHLTVMLLSRDMAQKKISAERLSDYTLGQAHLARGRAHIFCDRIAKVPGAPMFFSIALGDVIAHEVGHLLLRANSHSRSGIMRAHVDVQHTMHLQSFDKAQARTIHAALMEPSGPR
jgi:hypothetical protein